MIIKEKENDINHFNSAKKYINSNPADYTNSLKELNKISFFKQNISIYHMNLLCFLMLSQYEEIIEYYYLNKKYFDSLFGEKNEHNKEQKKEIKKIISLAFYNFNFRKKAKQICHDIIDEYNYEIENFEIEYFMKKVEKNNSGKIDSTRINTKKTLDNIKLDLDKNMNIIKQNKAKELMNISSIFVDDLFQLRWKIKSQSVFEVPFPPSSPALVLTTFMIL